MGYYSSLLREVEGLLDYFLGDYVYGGLRASDDYGGMIPPWTVVLSYEHAIRKHCYKIMAQEGMPFKLALEKSWKDATVNEQHFTTRLALYAKRGYTATSSSASATPGDKCGKGREKGKGEGKKGHLRTPDNKPICFRYNSKVGCKKKAKCHFEHVCTRCFGDHPATECPQKPLRIPRNRLSDRRQVRRRLKWYPLQLLPPGQFHCHTCLRAGLDKAT